MAEFAAIPLFTDSWIADTAHLTRGERGLYMDLLILIWRSPECRVPNDLSWIARRLRVENGEAETLQSIVAEFCQSTGNFLTQKRLKREWSYTFEKRKKNIASAKSRWNKQKDTSERTANAMPDTQCERNAPSPSPSPSVKEREANASPKKIGSRISPDWTLPSEWRDWAIGQGMSASVAEAQAERFRDYWLGKAGKDGVKTDWQATWRNWARKALEDGKSSPKASAHPQHGEERQFPDGTTRRFDQFMGWKIVH